MLFRSVKPLIIRISTDMLCNKRSNADIAFDWLAVLMLGEYLEQLDLNPDWTTVGSMGHILAIDFTVNSAINQTALEALQAYAAAYLSFYTGGRYPSSADYSKLFDYEQELLRFEDDIKSRVRRFDDIAKHYTSSFIAGLRDKYMGADYVMMLGKHQLRLKRWMDISALRCSA